MKIKIQTDRQTNRYRKIDRDKQIRRKANTETVEKHNNCKSPTLHFTDIFSLFCFPSFSKDVTADIFENKPTHFPHISS